jgi:hypothetical protein
MKRVLMVFLLLIIDQCLKSKIDKELEQLNSRKKMLHIIKMIFNQLKENH